MNPFDKFQGQELTQTPPDNQNWFQKTLDTILPKQSSLTSEQLANNVNVKIPFTGGRVASLGWANNNSKTFYDGTGEKVSGGPENKFASGATSLGVSYYTKFAEFIPRAAVTMYEETKNLIDNGGQANTVKLSPDLSYLMGGEDTYKTVNQTIQDKLNNGDGILSSYIGGISEKILDTTVGASVLTRGLSTLNKILTRGDFVSQIEAWKTLGSPSTPEELNSNFKQLSNQVYPRTTGADDTAFKVISNAKKVMDDNGLPGVLGTVKEKLAQYSEMIGRETKLTDPIWKLNLDVNKVQPSNLGLEALPGYAPKGGVEAPKVGLQIQPVEPVGFGENKQQEDPQKPENAPETIKPTEPAQSLVEEAKKYKSAEEFVKAQETTRKEIAQENIDAILNQLTTESF